jgi:hypothetical protein
MDWKKTLGVLAPTVASALGGPLAGGIVAFLGDLLGIGEPTQEKIAKAFENGQLTSEQIATIKLKEMELKSEEQERGFRYAELEFKDRDSARNREVQTGDKVNRNLAYFIIAAFVAMVGCTLGGLAKVDTVLAGTLIGYLSAKAEQVLVYYFGSTQGSARKTELLAQAEPIKE